MFTFKAQLNEVATETSSRTAIKSLTVRFTKRRIRRASYQREFQKLKDQLVTSAMLN